MNYIGKGEIGHQDYYTKSRALGDLYAFARGVTDEYAATFPDGSEVHFSKNAENNIAYSFTRKEPESVSVNKYFPDSAGHPYQCVEKALEECMEYAGYNEGNLLDMEGIAKAIVAAGVEFSNYNSDLYVPLNETTKAILGQYSHPNNVSVFRDEASEGHELMFEIPFAYDTELYAAVKAEMPTSITSSLSQETEVYEDSPSHKL